MFFFEQPKWKLVEHSRNRIIKSGKVVKNQDVSTEQFEESVRVVDNWRASHAYPMHVIYIHLRRMADSNPSIIVAERLKRLDSIINKIEARTYNESMDDTGLGRMSLHSTNC